MNYTLKDLIDIPGLQALLDTLDEIHSLPSAIIDIEGNILTATAWQDICTKFHRANPEAEKKCRESDSYIAGELERNRPNVIYRCPFGLLDTATPIIVDGRHLGNAFTGQLFTEPPDEERFIRQAREYAFDENAYLAALKKVPLVSEERLLRNLEFLGRFTEMLAKQGLIHLKQLKTEAALRESDARAKAMLRAIPDLMFRLDREGVFLDYRADITDLYAQSGQDIIGKRNRDLTPPEFADLIDRKIRATLDTGMLQTFEYQLPVPGRGLQDYEARMAVSGTDEVTAIVRNITERKKTEQALLTSEARLREAQRMARIGNWEWDMERQSLSWSDEVYRIFGLEPGTVEPSVDLFESTIHPDDREDFLARREKMLTEKNCACIDHRIVLPDGRIHHVQECAQLIFDDQGKVRRVIGTVQDITGRKKSEEALLTSEARLREAQEMGRIGNWELDVAANTLFWSDEVYRLFGMAKEDGVSLDRFLKKVHPEDLGNLRASIQESIESSLTSWQFEYRIMLDNGEVRFLHERAEADLDTCGSVLRRRGTVQDVTELKRSEVALRESTEQFRALVEQSLTGVALIQDGIFVYVNPRLAEIVGRTPEEMIGRSPVDLVVDGDREMVREKIRQRLSGEIDNVTYTFRARHKNGTEVTLELFGRTTTHQGKRAILSTLLDITERRRSERIQKARLRLNEYAPGHTLDELLTKTLDEAESLTGSSIGFFHFLVPDQKTLILQTWSTNTLQGLCMAEAKGNHYPVDKAGVWVDCVRENRSVIHNDYASLPHKKGLPQGHAPVIRELVVPVRRSGIITAILGVGNKESDYTPNDQELVEHFADFAWDMISHKISEEALRESEARYRHITEGLTDYRYTVIVENGRAVRTIHSPACSVVTGYTAEDFASDPELWIRMVAPEDREMVIQHANKILAGNDIEPVEHRIFRKNGEPRWINDTTILFRDASGTLLSYEGVIRDVTERRRLEEQLQQAQKMEAVGLLAGGVAHDFNNMLSAIISAASMLKMKTAKDSSQLHLLEQILSAADKSASLTQQLLAFSRKQIISPKQTDLNVLVSGMERLLARVIGEDIELKIATAKDRLISLVDPGQMEQVLMNLCTNARDAMTEGGTLSVRTASMELDNDVLMQHSLEKPGRYAVLSVSDTGEGMDQETRRRIFEPFFTTKKVGEGTGLGLSIVYGIIKQHKGDISVYSEPGEGTTFKIYLPLIQSGADDNKEEQPYLPPGGTETILLAEDSEEVRVTTGFLLREFGYRVIEAVDGEDAAARFQENIEAIDLVILDVIMPKRNGREAAEYMRKIRPDLKVLFTSGYTGDILHRKGIREDGLNFISKPVMPHDILAKIRSVLERK